jgi:hypothetical protein
LWGGGNIRVDGVVSTVVVFVERTVAPQIQNARRDYGRDDNRLAGTTLENVHEDSPETEVKSWRERSKKQQ